MKAFLVIFFLVINLPFFNLLAAEKSMELPHDGEHCRQCLVSYKEVIESIHKLTYTNPLYTQKKNSKKIGKNIKKNLLSFVEKKQVEVDFCQTLPIIRALVSFIHEIINNREIRIYFSEIDNVSSIIDRLFSCIKDNEMQLNVMTCPDYSGLYEKDDDEQVFFKLDFHKLGITEGFFGKISLPFVRAFYQVSAKYISNITINHFLPTFEFFPGGFTSAEESLPYEECERRLSLSAECIQRLYVEMGLKANVILTNKRINNGEFEVRKKDFISRLHSHNIDHPEVDNFISVVKKSRMDIYQRWNPKFEAESDSDYSERMENVAYSNIAEYLVDGGEILTHGAHDFGLVSDNTVMYGTYSILKCPVLWGKDALGPKYK